MAKQRVTILGYIVATVSIVLSPALHAQQPEPKPLRFDVSVFAGYRTSMSFPVDSNATQPSPRVVLDSSPSYGVSFGVRLREPDVVEIRWARQDSYVHTGDILPPFPRQHAVLDQFHLDCSHEPFVEQWPPWVRPFVMASVGGTNISVSNNNYTRFSFGIGGGIRFYPTRHLGFKVQGEWVPVYVDPQVAFICGGGCIVHAGGTISSQGEILVGPFLRF